MDPITRLITAIAILLLGIAAVGHGLAIADLEARIAKMEQDE